jgi:hypothetical protein
MRRLIATACAIASAVLLGGCGSQADEPVGASGSPATEIVQAAPGTLTVATSLSSGGPMYIEGALARMVLRDEDGSVVASGMKWPGKTFVFTELEPGTYVLEPALRPCDGNCGYLDPPTDSCEHTVTIDGDMSVRVEFSVGDPCVVGTMLRG